MTTLTLGDEWFVKSFHHHLDKREISKSRNLQIPRPPKPRGEQKTSQWPNIVLQWQHSLLSKRKHVSIYLYALQPTEVDRKMTWSIVKDWWGLSWLELIYLHEIGNVLSVQLVFCQFDQEGSVNPLQRGRSIWVEVHGKWKGNSQFCSVAHQRLPPNLSLVV